MFSSFKSLFSSKSNTDNKANIDYQENNSYLADQKTAEKTAEVEKEEEEKMSFRLSMDIFKEQDLSKKSFEISLYDSVKIYEKFYTEVLKNWR
jgi:hypothetical protein